MSIERLTGWGRASWSASDVSHPSTLEAVASAIVAARGGGPASRGVLVRGLGRSYGDAAMNGGGRVLRLGAFDQIGPVGADGVVELGAGVSLHDLLARVVPLGWFPPVTPGTQHVTIGGAVSADVHGKNHHEDGSLGAHLTHIDVLDGLGGPRRLLPDDAAYGAVVGGMGLAGVITGVGMRLRPIGTASLTVHTTRTRDLDDTMARLVADDATHRYTVAWVDTLSRGSSLGRGVVTSGDHTPADADGSPQALTAYRAKARVSMPPWLPSGLLTRARMRAFNEAVYRRSPRRPSVDQQPIPAFFHPLDVIDGWNRAYGAAGFVQYQLATPEGSLVRDVIATLQRERVAGFLAVLKRFGPAAAAPLSFPTAGWTLTVDIPADRSLAPLLDRLDERVVAAGGRVYLAKDGRLRPELVPAMYPRLDDWRELRAGLDPHDVFASDLSRRLHLC